MLLSAVVLMAASPDVNAIRTLKLHQYNFVRGVAQFHDLELLLGNTEMGSTAKQNGLGFERLWFSEYIKNRRRKVFYHFPPSDAFADCLPEFEFVGVVHYNSLL